MLLWMIFDYIAVKKPELQFSSSVFSLFFLLINPMIGFVAAWFANDDESPRQRTYDAAAGALFFFGLGFLIIITFGLWFHVEIGGPI